MAYNIRFRPPPEPAHVSIVRQYDDLVAILKYIRDTSQGVIDQAFDSISSKIGFVVATTIPVTIDMAAEKGTIRQLRMRGEHLQGTLFADELLPALKKTMKESIPAAKGSIVKESYDIYLIWFDALKLKLGGGSFLPPAEPAHFLGLSAETARALARFRPPPEPAHYRSFAADLARILATHRPPPEPAHIFRPPPEPAHWFDAGILVSQEEQVLIMALDEVYPELRLVERIGASRGEEVSLNPQPLPPGEMEMEAAAKPSPDPWKCLTEALARVMNNPNPSPWKAKALEELAEIIRRYS